MFTSETRPQRDYFLYIGTTKKGYMSKKEP